MSLIELVETSAAFVVAEQVRRLGCQQVVYVVGYSGAAGKNERVVL